MGNKWSKTDLNTWACAVYTTSKSVLVGWYLVSWDVAVQSFKIRKWFKHNHSRKRLLHLTLATDLSYTYDRFQKFYFCSSVLTRRSTSLMCYIFLGMFYSQQQTKQLKYLAVIPRTTETTKSEFLKQSVWSVRERTRLLQSMLQVGVVINPASVKGSI